MRRALLAFIAAGLIVGCVPLPPSDPPPTTTTIPLAFALDCHGGTHGTVTLSDLDGVAIRNCAFDLNAIVQLVRVTHAIVDGNTFTSDTNAAGITILDSDGTHNTITNNHVSGQGGAVGCCFVGIDDAIGLQNVTHDLIQGNVLDRSFDCGIETLGYVTDTTIDNNTITNNRTCGIGGWYDLDWQRNTVTNNHVAGSQLMFRFFWKQNLRTAGQFTNNTFRSNIATAMLTTAQNSLFATDLPIVTSGNVVSGNDFDAGEQFAPQFYPNTPEAFSGAGNLCGARSQSGGSGPCPN